MPETGARKAAGLPLLAGAAMLGLASCSAMDPDLSATIERESAALAPAVGDQAAVDEAARRALDNWQPGAVALPDDAGLGDFVAVALERSPAIRRAVRDVEARGYAVPQVRSLDDPMISLLPPIGDLAQTAAGAVDGQLGVSQKIPFPGRLKRRGRVAEQEVRMALADLSGARVRVASDTARAYYDYYLADVSLGVTRTHQDLLARIRDVASARYRSGESGQDEVLRADVELHTLANERITLEQRRRTAGARLNALMNRPVDAPLPAPRPFDLESVEWKLPDALELAARSNPSLARLREQVRRDVEAGRLARLRYFPDLQVGVSYTWIGSGISPVASGDDQWGFPLGLALPVWWKRIRAGVLEANARTLASVEALEDARRTVAFALQDTLVQVDTQYRQALLYRDRILPLAAQAVEVSTASYRSGRTTFAALIDNERNYLDASLAYYRALARLEQRFADLQQLVGIRVPRSPSAPAEAGNEAATVPVAEPAADRRQES